MPAEETHIVLLALYHSARASSPRASLTRITYPFGCTTVSCNPGVMVSVGDMKWAAVMVSIQDRGE